MTRSISIVFVALFTSTAAFAQSSGGMNGGIHTAPTSPPPTSGPGIGSPGTTGMPTITAPMTGGMPANGMMATSDDVRTRLEANGYRKITAIQQNADGSWRASAVRNAVDVVVIVDQRGAISSQ